MTDKPKLKLWMVSVLMRKNEDGGYGQTLLLHETVRCGRPETAMVLVKSNIRLIHGGMEVDRCICSEIPVQEIQEALPAQGLEFLICLGIFLVVCVCAWVWVK